MRPTTAQKQTNETPTVRQRQALAFPNILVVEDENILRRLIVRNLASRGHTVRGAATAEEALRSLEADPPDLLLLDINLPDRTGWDVLRELRQRGQAIPTVVVSAVRVGPARLGEFQPLAYLPKPFPLEVLLRIARQGCGQPTNSGRVT
ncbi:MAG: response regulator transcription factor [Chloroflexota bacterium]